MIWYETVKKVTCVIPLECKRSTTEWSGIPCLKRFAMGRIPFHSHVVTLLSMT